MRPAPTLLTSALWTKCADCKRRKDNSGSGADAANSEDESMADDDFEPSSNEPGNRPRWLSRLAWPLLSLLSLLVFELTAEPALTSLVLCSKFGLENLLTGIWLWRTDPKAGRGAACFWFSLMVGVIKILLSSSLLAVVFVVSILWVNAGGAQPRAAPRVGTALVMLFGIAAATEALLMIFGLSGCVVARRHKVKIWISPVLHRARRAGQWPPGPAPNTERINWADRALVPSIAIGIIAIATCALLLIFEVGLHPLPTVIVALVIAALVVWLSRGVTAKTFEECWPEAKIS